MMQTTWKSCKYRAISLKYGPHVLLHFRSRLELCSVAVCDVSESSEQNKWTRLVSVRQLIHKSPRHVVATVSLLRPKMLSNAPKTRKSEQKVSCVDVSLSRLTYWRTRPPPTAFFSSATTCTNVLCRLLFPHPTVCITAKSRRKQEGQNRDGAVAHPRADHEGGWQHRHFVGRGEEEAQHWIGHGLR